MPPSICVFCASSHGTSAHFVSDAQETGRALGNRGWPLVYGGGSVGLMGEVARATHLHGGRVVGVIPETLRTAEVAYEAADELLVTATMTDRKRIMISRSDAFLHLAGGFGTLDEMLEVITLRILRFIDAPILIVNTGGYWDGLLAFFERVYRERLAREAYRELYTVTPDVESAFEILDRKFGVVAP